MKIERENDRDKEREREQERKRERVRIRVYCTTQVEHLLCRLSFRSRRSIHFYNAGSRLCHPDTTRSSDSRMCSRWRSLHLARRNLVCNLREHVYDNHHSSRILRQSSQPHFISIIARHSFITKKINYVTLLRYDDKFVCSAISNPRDCSNRFTLYPLTGLCTRIQCRLLWVSIKPRWNQCAKTIRVQISTTHSFTW